tara:strand:+ start:474 stop:632 length:159 start_codon:yes stop_codon:yes gene_type:complete
VPLIPSGAKRNAPTTDSLSIKLHRVLMQKLHPDRGGNNYIATKLNLAVDGVQ